MSAPPASELHDDFEPATLLATFVRKLIRIRVVAAAIGLLILAMCVPAAARLGLDRNITAMFATADQTRVDYEELQEAFGGNAIAILVYVDRSMFTPEGIARSKEIADEVVSIPGVKDNGVLSPSQLSRAVETLRPSGVLSGFPKDLPGLMRENDEVAKRLDQLFAGYTHSADHHRGAVVIILDPDYPKSTIRQLKNLAASLKDKYPDVVENAAVVGEPVLVNDAFALIERDGAKLATLTISLLSIVVLISLVDLRFVILTGLIIVWSINVTQALMVLLDVQLSLISTIMTSIVTVIAVATVLHVGVRFRLCLARGYSQHRAALSSLSTLLLPVLWTCATDAAGFAALGWSRILPVRVFGLTIAIAASAVLFATLLFAPMIMMLPGFRFADSLQKRQRKYARWLRKWCLRLAQWTVGHRRPMVLGALVAAVLVSIGVSQTQVETSFLNNFRPNNPIVVTYDEIENKFGGAGVWDIILDAPLVLTDDYIAQVIELQDALRNLNVNGATLTKVLSLADTDRAIALSPIMKFAQPAIRIGGMRVTIPVFVDALLTPMSEAKSGNRKFRIVLRSREHLDAKQKTDLIAAVENTVAKFTSQPNWIAVSGSEEPGRVTGYYVMMARLISQLIDDQWRCFFASGLLVWFLLLIATHSIRLSVAALLPNLLPVLLTLTLVGFLGGKINMGATMIAAVSIGLSIDGSVHFLASYQRRRSRGHRCDQAATHAAGSIGVPVLLATVALVFGFSVLTTSEFIPTATFGLLVATTLAAGTAINLTLLPAFVTWIDGDIRAQRPD